MKVYMKNFSCTLHGFPCATRVSLRFDAHCFAPLCALHQPFGAHPSAAWQTIVQRVLILLQ